MIPAIILAAGQSRRMGAPKALLPDRDGVPFVVRIARTLARAGADDLVVVVGAEGDEICAALEPAGVGAAVLQNPDPTRGQLSSLQTALVVLDRPGVEAALVTLVDVPFVSRETIASILHAYRQSPSLVVRPANRGRHGHPVIFDRGLFPELRRQNPALGAKPVVHAHSNHVLDVAVDDEGAFQDIDTPEEYERLTGRRVPT